MVDLSDCMDVIFKGPQYKTILTLISNGLKLILNYVGLITWMKRKALNHVTG